MNYYVHFRDAFYDLEFYNTKQTNKPKSIIYRFIQSKRGPLVNNKTLILSVANASQMFESFSTLRFASSTTLSLW